MVITAASLATAQFTPVPMSEMDGEATSTSRRLQFGQVAEIASSSAEVCSAQVVFAAGAVPDPGVISAPDSLYSVRHCGVPADVVCWHADSPYCVR
jgi:hypothetical protein